MKKQKVLKTLEEIRAFSDPYRLQILSWYRKLKKPATVKEIADKMEETPAKVYYHVKKLEKVGILRLITTKEINGIIAKYYGLTAEHFTINYEKIDPAITKTMMGETQRMIGTMYDESKNTVLNRIGKMETSDETKEKEKMAGDVASGEIYLTDEEAKEFQQYIDNFFEKHEKRRKDIREKEYHYFITLLTMDE